MSPWCHSPTGRRSRKKSPGPAPNSCSRRANRPDSIPSLIQGALMFELTNGIKTHYVIDGPEGAPWVTFITGIANDTTMWEEQARALADKFRVLRYDLRGQGQSKSTPGDYSVDLLCRDLLALWDALKISRTHLVGLGLGGSISIALA